MAKNANYLFSPKIAPKCPPFPPKITQDHMETQQGTSNIDFKRGTGGLHGLKCGFRKITFFSPKNSPKCPKMPPFPPKSPGTPWRLIRDHLAMISGRSQVISRQKQPCFPLRNLSEPQKHKNWDCRAKNWKKKSAPLDLSSWWPYESFQMVRTTFREKFIFDISVTSNETIVLQSVSPALCQKILQNYL